MHIDGNVFAALRARARALWQGIGPAKPRTVEQERAQAVARQVAIENQRYWDAILRTTETTGMDGRRGLLGWLDGRRGL